MILKRTRDCERKSSTPFKKRRSSLKSKTQSVLEWERVPRMHKLGKLFYGRWYSWETPPSSSPTISTPAYGNNTFICFDLETAGLGLSSVTQKTARCIERQFNEYVLPDEEGNQQQLGYLLIVLHCSSKERSLMLYYYLRVLWNFPLGLKSSTAQSWYPIMPSPLTLLFLWTVFLNPVFILITL